MVLPQGFFECVRLIFTVVVVHYLKSKYIVISVNCEHKEVAMIINKLRTWDHYPRAKYFQRYLQNVYPRFRRVTVSLPIDPHDEKILDEISVEVKPFDVPPELVVIGNESFPIAKMVVRCTQEMLSQKQLEGSGPRVAVCFLQTGPGTEAFRQALTATLQEEEQISLANTNLLTIVCHVAKQHINLDQDVLQQIFNESCKHLQDKHLIIYNEQESQSSKGASSNMLRDEHYSLGQVIDNSLEKGIVDILVKMYCYLGKFIVNSTKPKQVFPLGRSLEDFYLSLGNNLIHYLSDKDFFQEKVEVEKSEIHLEKIARRIRCTCVMELSRMLNVNPTVCGHVIDRMKFESTIQSLLTSTHVSFSETKLNKKKLKKFVDGVLTDIPPFLDDVTANLNMSTGIVKKMRHELQNCIKQSNTDRLPEQRTHVPDSLLQAISSINGVYGFGEVFGELEFHIEEEGHKKTLEDIDSIIREYNYLAPYKVLFVAKKAEKFAYDLHDNGKRISAQFQTKDHKNGTLGAFLVNEDNTHDLFAITCGHVVSFGTDSIAETVLIKEGKDFVMLGTPLQNMTLNGIIDIAAIKVLDSLKPRCLTRLKNDQGICCPAHIVNISPIVIANEGLFPYVYKHGGSSGLTYGIVSSSNFQFRTNKKSFTDCVLLIEPQPDIEMTPFGKPGDSGAVVCGRLPGSDDIQVLTTLTSGEYILVGDPINRCLSFMLHRGLEALKANSNIGLVLPNV